MSDNILRLIPVDPEFVPAASAQEKARDLLASLLPDADEVGTSVFDHVIFVDQGANYARVLCPNCGSELDRQWWQEMMNAASETDFSQLQVTLPCCGSTLSLNELQYVSPAGFARYVLEARNPRGDIRDEDLRLLGHILNSELKEIRAHY